MKPAWFMALLATVAAGWAGLDWRLHRRAGALRAELAACLAQGRELSLARVENDARRARRLPPEELAQLRREHAELERREAKRSAGAGSTRDSAAAPAGDPRRSPAEAWAWRGRDTPAAALESALWAFVRQDTRALAPLLVPTAQGQAELAALYDRLPETSRRQFGSPEMVLATLVAANLPEGIEAATTLGTTSPEDTGDPGHASIVMQLEADGRTGRPIALGFQQSPQGWQLMVPTAVFEGYARKLAAGPNSSPAAPSGPAEP